MLLILHDLVALFDLFGAFFEGRRTNGELFALTWSSLFDAATLFVVH